MIPFASQRGGGQDLATHLMNEHDNEYMELAALRGAIAQDLHGAFAEWEAQAKALTKCRQYLCSLSVNPDELQGRITREQYFDYIERAEEKLGLSGQPRAVIFHIKEGEQGRMREHCHVVWSRIDAERNRAVNLSFFKDKMMTVTREFARDHNIDLPKGYYRHEDEYRRNRQLSSYDCVKQKETGITHEERMAMITKAWQRSDSSKAFVNALEEHGYILARGRNKTRVVLVDLYGHTTAVTRLIDDPAVRAKDVRKFLGPDYAPELLPSVEEAQGLAAQHRKAIADFEKARLESEQVFALQEKQAARRGKLERQFAHLKQVQHEERAQLVRKQKTARQKQKTVYLAEKRRIRIARAQKRPQGLAAFLGKVTGVSLITKKIDTYRDRKRYGAYLAAKIALKQRQQEEASRLRTVQYLRAADLKRKLRGLDKIERRERDSLEQARRRQQRQRINARSEHMPAMSLELKPRGRKAVPHKAAQRHISPVGRELAKATEDRKAREEIKLAEEFKRVSGADGDGESGRDESGARQPAQQSRQKDQDHKQQRLTREFAKAADDGKGDSEGGDGRTGGPKPAAEPKRARRKNRREQQPQKEKRQEKSERRNDKERDQDQQRQRRRRRKRDLDRGM